MADVYNLQVPISPQLEKKLKELAKDDGRSLRQYCRKILEAHADIQCENKSVATTESNSDMMGYDFNFED